MLSNDQINELLTLDDALVNVMTLNRATLGDPRRTQYVVQLQNAGRAELAHLAQWAVSTGNAALAAAIMSRVDSMPSGQRPFPGIAIAESLRLKEHCTLH